MKKLKWYQGIAGLIEEYKLNENKLIYKSGVFKKQTIEISVSEIPYLIILGGTLGVGKGCTDFIEKGKRGPLIALTNKIKLWLLNQTDENMALLRYYDKEELIGLFLYENIFEDIIKRGFCGEIYIVSDLYNNLQIKWTEYARQGLIDMEKVHIYDTWASVRYN